MPKKNQRKYIIKLEFQALWRFGVNPVISILNKRSQGNLIRGDLCGIIKYQINQIATETLFQRQELKTHPFIFRPGKFFNLGIKEFMLSFFCLAMKNLPGQGNLSANYCLQVRNVFPCQTNVLSTLVLGLNNIILITLFPALKFF